VRENWFLSLPSMARLYPGRARASSALFAAITDRWHECWRTRNEVGCQGNHDWSSCHRRFDKDESSHRVHGIVGKARAQRITTSRQTPDTALDVKQQSGVAEDLELLTDFIADMPIIGMEFFQFAGGIGSACVPHAAFGVPPNAPGNVCNGTLQTATGTVALPSLS